MELTGYDIKAIIDGMSELVAKNPKGDVVIVRLKDLKEYLINVKSIAEALLGSSPPKNSSKNSNPDNWLNARDAAELLSCSRLEVNLMIKNKKIRGRVVGRGCYVDPESIKEFLAQKAIIRPASGSTTSPDTVVPQDNVDENSGDNNSANDSSMDIVIPADDTDQKGKGEEDPPITGDDSVDPLPVEVPEKPAEPAGVGSEAPPKKPDLADSKTLTIRKRQHGCLTDDVAEALKISPISVRKWIADPNSGVKHTTIGDVDYITPESLKAFLFKQRNTTVLFEEKRMPIKA